MRDWNDPFSTNAKNQPRNGRDWTGPIIVLAVSPVAFLLLYLGRPDLARSSAIGLGMILLAIRIRWDLRGHWWFWATIAFVAALHVPLLTVIRWPSGWTPAVEILPFAVIDFFVIVGSVHGVEKLVQRTKSPSPER